MIGRQVARYRIVDEVGSGGMGVVYSAQDLRLGRRVALKVLPPELASDEQHIERFRREACMLAALDHPGIVTVYSCEESEGVVFITMQLVLGVSLDKCIPKGGLPVDRVVEIALRVAGALGVAHREGIVHRDVKPSNIMVGDDGQVKVLDFGLARSSVLEDGPTESAADSRVQTRTRVPTITTKGAIAGTVAYMAPEQLDGKPATSRSDIYSLGLVLYEMATGQRAYRGPERGKAPSALQVKPELPRRLNDLISRCMRRDPGERWSTTADVQRELGRLGPGSRSDDPRGAHEASVAVLPLVDRSSKAAGDRDDVPNWFADGLAESLVTGLARLDSLRVTSIEATSHYRGREPTPSQVGQELGVDYALTGSVLRSGGRARTIVRLVDTSSERVVWTDEYTREVEDVLSVQGDVARAVAHEIDLKLSPEESERVSGKMKVRAEAQEKYQMGRYYWKRRFEGELKRAIDEFRGALELEPEYTSAYSGLADCQIVLGWYAFLPPEMAFESARKAATRALEIDPHSAEALTSLAGVVHLYDWNFERAQAIFERALEINRSYAHGHWWYAFLLMTQGRPEACHQQTRAAIKDDPVSPHIRATAGWMRYLDAQYEQAEVLLLRTLESDRGFALTNIFLGWLHERLGRYDEAMASWERALEKLTMLSLHLQAAHTLAVMGQPESARQRLAAVEEKLGEYWVSPCQRAVVYLALGERDRAWELIGQGVEVRDPWVLTLGLDYRFSPLKEEESFRGLLRDLASGKLAR